MGNAFQDQFLKMGLTDKKKVKNADKERIKKLKQKQKNKVEEVDPVKLQAQKAQQEKVERDRQLNLQRKQEAEAKAVAAQIRQLIEMNRQPRGNGELSYSFTDGSKVKNLYVTESQQKQLSNGRLAIAKLDDQYELVPASVAEKIRQRGAEYIILCNEVQETADADDPYADYQIPDDLMW